MNVTVAGQHIEIGESLRDTAVDKIKSIEETYNLGVTNVEVTFSRSRKGFECRIHAHFRNGDINTSGESDTIYKALNRAATKAIKRARRIHREKADRGRETIRVGAYD